MLITITITITIVITLTLTLTIITIIITNIIMAPRTAAVVEAGYGLHRTLAEVCRLVASLG